MKHIIVDFRFVEVDHELWALREYFSASERQLPVLAEQERKRENEKWHIGDNIDEDEWALVQQDLHERIENILPRYFRAPILVALWAIYESATNEVAGYLQKQGGHEKCIKDTKGTTTL
jgi:hypothetical protein